ncbi:hypothetical protein GOP47_0018819 [Adiantum capillus-veneris]|uniref:Glucan endo-1,3-beta-D-glucosidase n=1 Tax=Adiantum capillus-veneris TaxID=13818 RepID=A0A9D4UE93_ADICA|nr:hypothetical protein GOP47_0018819 [Adiantum capillus-veneris]
MLGGLSASVLLTLVLAYYQGCAEGAGSVGVAYGRLGNNLPPHGQVVRLLQANGFKSAMIYDTEPAVLEAFIGSGIGLTVQATNEELQSLASDADAAHQWVQVRILPYASTIKYIAIGNEVLTADHEKSPLLYPSMVNIRNALIAFNLDSVIKVSTTHAANVLDATSSFPPSNGQFNASLLQYMEPILGFLSLTEAPFMANVYPFLAYLGANGDIKLPYALLESASAPNQIVVDGGAGLMYTNLFDAQLDTFVSALEKLGYGNLALVVTETGWPSGGGTDATSVVNAQKYVNNVLAHVMGGTGTPRRPALGLQVFIFALFNENEKTGPEYERHFGLFYPDQSRVYDLTL